jgi:essential nuclear protein 1
MQALDALLPSNALERRTLADLIFAKLDEADAQAAAGPGSTALIKSTGRADRDGRPDPAEGLNPKVVEVYTKSGFSSHATILG